MITVRQSAIVFVALLILVISCGDDSPTGHGDQSIDNRFPNSIGMLWKYRVYDSLTHDADTVWFSFTDAVRIAPDEFVVEQRGHYIGKRHFDWQYLRFRKDTLERLDDTVGVTASERIVFPLELGNSWTGPETWGDTSEVAVISQIEVPAGEFSGGTRIDRSWNRDFEGGGNWSEAWVVPDVGVVQRHYLSQYSDGATITVTWNETWELIDYDLTTFAIHQFPDDIGTTWTYEQIDSAESGLDSAFVSFDTITVTVARSGLLESGATYTLWELVSSIGVDTLYVVIDGDRMRVQRDTLSNPLWDWFYEFPLAVGRIWGMDYFAPVPEVLDKEPVLTAVQLFPSCFHTRMVGGAFNDYWSQEDWLVPGVGIVRNKRWQFGFIPSMNRSWNLIGFYAAGQDGPPHL